MSVHEPLRVWAHRLGDALDRAGFPNAIVGALARNAWARPRASTDVDMTIGLSADQMPALRSLIAGLGLIVRREHTVDPGDAVFDLMLLAAPDDPAVRLDLLVAKTPFEQEALTRRVKAIVEGAVRWVITPEDLIVYKLVAGRSRDLADVEEVAATVALARPIDWEYVMRHSEDFGVTDRATALRQKLGQ